MKKVDCRTISLQDVDDIKHLWNSLLGTKQLYSGSDATIKKFKTKIKKSFIYNIFILIKKEYLILNENNKESKFYTYCILL